jgi:hypothetical protein
LWCNEGVDVSLKEGLFIKLCSDNKYYEDDLGEVCDSEVTDANFECTDTFARFGSPSHNDAISRDKTPTPKVHISISLNSSNHRSFFFHILCKDWFLFCNTVVLVTDSFSLFVPGL